MGQILISFFAVVGITLLGIRAFDFLFYRKFHSNLALLVDLRGKSPETVIEIFELIALVRLRSSGRAAISELKIVLDEGDTLLENLTHRFLREYHLPAVVYYSWQDPVQEYVSENADGIKP